MAEVGVCDVGRRSAWSRRRSHGCPVLSPIRRCHATLNIIIAHKPAGIDCCVECPDIDTVETHCRRADRPLAAAKSPMTRATVSSTVGAMSD